VYTLLVRFIDSLGVQSIECLGRVQFMDKTTLGSAAILGIRHVSSSRSGVYKNNLCLRVLGKTTISRRTSMEFYLLVLDLVSLRDSLPRYNWLGTIFYLSYLVFEYPQNLALQRFPVGKWMRYALLTFPASHIH